MVLNCIVVDDQPPLAGLIASYVERTPSLKLIRCTTSPLEAMELVKTRQIDLVFLEVEMAECSGIEFIGKVKGRTHIILCTAYSQYALDAFEHDVIDFLLKPVCFERFTRAVEKAKKAIAAHRLLNEKGHLFLTGGTRNQKIKIHFSDIDYIRSFRNYTAFYCGRKKIVSRINIGHVEKQLPQSMFLRVYISYIIPVSKIKSFDYRLILLHNIAHQIPIGATYRQAVLKVLNAYNTG